MTGFFINFNHCKHGHEEVKTQTNNGIIHLVLSDMERCQCQAKVLVREQHCWKATQITLNPYSLIIIINIISLLIVLYDIMVLFEEVMEHFFHFTGSPVHKYVCVFLFKV